MVAACCQIDAAFPIVHISDWQEGACLSLKDPALLMTLRETGMILVGFDRASLPMHAGTLTREGLGHAGIILFRRSVPTVAYGKQARLLAEFWRNAATWDWMDRIEICRGYNVFTFVGAKFRNNYSASTLRHAYNSGHSAFCNLFTAFIQMKVRTNSKPTLKNDLARIIIDHIKKRF